MMKRNTSRLIPAVLLLQLCVFPAVAETSVELKDAEETLRAAGEKFLAVLDRIDDVYWDFKPTGFRHTIGEEAEHVALTQQGLQQTVLKALNNPNEPEKAKALAGKEQFLKEHMLDPNNPAENFKYRNKLRSKAEVIEYFTMAQKKALDLLERAPNPEVRIFKHPNDTYGELTALQWFYYIAYHCERHTNWIQKMIDHPEFREGAGAGSL